MTKNNIKIKAVDKRAIEIVGLTKIFKSFVGIDKINIRVKTGSIHGLIGPNGLGKPTTIKCLVDYFCQQVVLLKFLGKWLN